jgi:hypothetical protein
MKRFISVLLYEKDAHRGAAENQTPDHKTPDRGQIFGRTSLYFFRAIGMQQASSGATALPGPR